LEGSGLKKATTKAISKRLNSLHNGLSLSAPIFSILPDAHTSGKTEIIYADYAGAPPYSISAVKAATEELLNGVWGNPHSDQIWETSTSTATATSITSVTSSSAAADRLRQLTLDMCQADPNEYVCILTSGATAALKLVADSFSWSSDAEGDLEIGSRSRFMYLSDNHNSVIGIREVAALHGASTQCIHPSDIQITSTEKQLSPPSPSLPSLLKEKKLTQHLFAFPLESNFSGTRYSEDLVLAIQNQTLEILPDSTTANSTSSNGKWRVLVDAAKACATHPPNLSTYPADFVVLSYYKIFGYPTGLGALLVKRDALSTLRKTYFGGGSVLSSSADDRFHALRPGYAGFEDGTLSFLAFPAVLQSFSAWHHRGGFPAAEIAATAAASRFAEKLLAMKHGNGTPVATIYGQWNSSSSKINIINGQGPTVTFNLLDSSGTWVGHRQVQRIASLEGIYLRTGVMCNPGACSAATGVKTVQVKAWFDQGHVCWDDQDVLDGIPTGAVRVSFGWGSSIDDADCIANFIKRHFLDVSTLTIATTTTSKILEETIEENGLINKIEEEKVNEHDDLRIHSLNIYPIKSAAGFSPRSWPINPTSGFLYDRHWAVVDRYGSILTLKQCPKLSSLHPVVYLEDKVMRIHAEEMPDVLEIPLPDLFSPEKTSTTSSPSLCSSTCSLDTIEWLTEALGIPCSLIVYNSQNKINNNNTNSHHGFSNEAQFLLVTTASVQKLYKNCGIESSFEKFTARFRPNIVVEEKYLPPLFDSSQSDEHVSSNSGGIAASLGSGTAAEGKKEKDRESTIEIEDELLAFEEEQWASIRLHDPHYLPAPSHRSLSGNVTNSSSNNTIDFEVVGPCPRCEMICIDPTTGIRQGPEPLLTLAKERKGAGKRRFCFGVLLNVKEGSGGVEEKSDDGREHIEVNRMRRVAVGMHVGYEDLSKKISGGGGSGATCN
jgi:molybdenum cofactor sulfurtransferase